MCVLQVARLQHQLSAVQEKGGSASPEVRAQLDAVQQEREKLGAELKVLKEKLEGVTNEKDQLQVCQNQEQPTKVFQCLVREKDSGNITELVFAWLQTRLKELESSNKESLQRLASQQDEQYKMLEADNKHFQVSAWIPVFTALLHRKKEA